MLADVPWSWAYLLSSRHGPAGYLVVAAPARPRRASGSCCRCWPSAWSWSVPPVRAGRRPIPGAGVSARNADNPWVYLDISAFWRLAVPRDLRGGASSEGRRGPSRSPSDPSAHGRDEGSKGLSDRLVDPLTKDAARPKPSDQPPVELIPDAAKLSSQRPLRDGGSIGLPERPIAEQLNKFNQEALEAPPVRGNGSAESAHEVRADAPRAALPSEGTTWSEETGINLTAELDSQRRDRSDTGSSGGFGQRRARCNEATGT
jgi:hypothetical protein